MNWKSIGQSVVGKSHSIDNKACEDHICYETVSLPHEQVLLCCASDGAGSAMFAAEASNRVTQRTMQLLKQWLHNGTVITEALLLQMIETIYDELQAAATHREIPLNEFACTLLGCIVYRTSAVFFQVGDGAIVRHDGNEGYSLIWWPHNGEYQNSTAFIVDDRIASQFKVQLLNEAVHEVAIITDGLQLLALNTETMSPHQPFFADMFKWLRLADDEKKLHILQQKLGDYLNSPVINNRTDDDKTLFLASRIQP
ncbi:PP2C family serine/threonine-protein phosphatase [Deminuibacter soli]|uniref:Protein phosphatase 2C domain-containing protein n=1 Tax=Deminuibacter soli TaxID=2291815 RepID=A0A3E1NKP4_9BACT|nr:PP2C family serine/threonine-protein phosphatase [Deminuibacter soli]RFM28461.1 protein phosphatase 2C domain-containing protein [Deminuibacter soli]